MSSCYKEANETIYQFQKNDQFDSCWQEKYDENGGFTALIRCGEDEFYKFRWFISVGDKCVNLWLSLPVESNFGHMEGYIDCVNKAKTIKSEMMIGEWFKIEFHRSVCFNDRSLSSVVLRQDLTEMIEEADTFLPVIEAIAQDKSVPIESGEASRLFYKVYVPTQEYVVTEEHLKRAREEAESDRRRADENEDLGVGELLGEALSLQPDHFDSHLNDDSNIKHYGRYREMKKKDLLSRFNELTEQEKDILRYRYGFIDSVHHTIPETAEHFGCSYYDVKVLIRHMTVFRYHCHHNRRTKLKDFLD